MKKILSLILALVMTLSMATFIFADDAAITTAAPEEVDETASAYYDAVKFLVAYDIMHGKGDGVLGVYDNIKRYEMALFIGRILTGWVEDKAWEDGTQNSSEFKDLEGTAAENYYGAISFVNQAGVIEGYGDGRFGPENGITYQDALTMAVRALGFQGLAYPWGYIQKAVNLGLTDGISGVAFTDELKREVVAQIIYNALFAETAEGETLAAKSFGINGTWCNVIIVDTSYIDEDLPAGYVGYAIVNEDGTLADHIYYVPESEFGFTNEHDAEKAFNAMYKVLLDGEDILALTDVELEPVLNRGRLEVTTKGYPIQAFLADYDIVPFYTGNLFGKNEIIIASIFSTVEEEGETPSYYAVDWATGNIEFFEGDEHYVVWYYNELLDAYFQFEFTADGDVYGVRWMTDAERAALPEIVNGDIIWVNGLDFNTLEDIESGSTALNAYATLRIFDPDQDGIAEYGIYDEYRFGIFNNNGTTYSFTDVSYTPVSAAGHTAITIPADAAWFTDGEVPADGAYVIYGVRPITGEITIIKTITTDPIDDGDTYVGHGYVRGFNADSFSLTIGEDKLNYNYPQLKGSIGETLAKGHDSNAQRPGGGYAAWASVASRWVKDLFNEYVEYVVVDGRLVYVTLNEVAGTGLFVVEAYKNAGGGFYNVWGYDIDANLANRNNDLTLLKIRAINGRTSGEVTSADVNAIKRHGNVLKVSTYDAETQSYNVVDMGYDGLDVLAIEDNKIELDYPHASVNVMQERPTSTGSWPSIPGNQVNTDHNTSGRLMSDSDTYTFLIGGEGADFTVPILTYEGKVIDTTWYVHGYKLPGNKSGNYVIYVEDLDDINGFYSRASQGAGLIIFIEYGQGFEINGSEIRYDAHVFDLITGGYKTVQVLSKNFRAAGYYKDGEQVGEYGDYYKIDIGEVNAVLATGFDPDAYDCEVDWYNCGIVSDHDVDVGDMPTKAELLAMGFDVDSYAEWELRHNNSIWRYELYVKHYFIGPDGWKNADWTGNTKDGYYWFPFMHFNTLVGDVYRTVGDVVYDQTPVAPAKVPTLLNAIVGEGNLFQDGYFKEIGLVTAKYNGSVGNIDKLWNTGWGSQYAGMRPLNINERFTYYLMRDVGITQTYVRLRSIGLQAGGAGGDLGKSCVFVWGIKETDGRLEIKHVACDDGGGKNLKTESTYAQDWAAVHPNQALSFFGDSRNNTQSYWYTLIFTADSSNTGKTGNDRSYCNIYYYDFTDDPNLTDPDFFDPTSDPSTFALGFENAEDYPY